jgi:hypothetical protein
MAVVNMLLACGGSGLSGIGQLADMRSRWRVAGVTVLCTAVAHSRSWPWRLPAARRGGGLVWARAMLSAVSVARRPGDLRRKLGRELM